MAPNRITLSERPPRDLLSRIDRTAARVFKRKPAVLDLHRAVVSFTFDDVPHSAVRNGARILSERGYRGTFYLCGGLCESEFGPWRFFSRNDVGRLFDGGHEIGCHTFAHPIMQGLGPPRLVAELDRNREWLGSLAGRTDLTNFAYPYGAVGCFEKSRVAARFDSCRGVRHGLNAGIIDLAQLAAVQLYDVRLDAAGLEAIIAQAVARRAWLIFYTHDVRGRPTWQGCSPELLRRAIELACDAGCQILPCAKHWHWPSGLKSRLAESAAAASLYRSNCLPPAASGRWRRHSVMFQKIPITTPERAAW